MLDFSFGFIVGLLILAFMYLIVSFIMWEFIDLGRETIRLAICICTFLGLITYFAD